jgi:PAS domain S-box-containing protein
MDEPAASTPTAPDASGNGGSALTHLDLSRLVSMMAQGVMYVDADGAVLAMNPAAERLLGTPASKVVGREVGIVHWEAVHEDGTPVSQDEYPVNVAMRTRRPVIGRVIGVRALDTGEVRWLSVSATPEADAPAGHPRRVFATFEDVTELRAAGEVLATALTGEREARVAAEQTSARLVALQAVTDAALTHLALDDLLGELVHRLTETLHVDNVAILLLDESGKRLRMRRVKGPEEAVASQVSVPVGVGFAGRIAATGNPWVVDDVKSIEVATLLLREKLASIAGVPLSVGDRVIGVMHVGTIQPRHFREEEVSLLEAAASRIALAVDHARLYEDLTRAHAETSTVASRLEATFDTMTDAVLISDREGHIVRRNRALVSLLGYATDDTLELRPAGERAAAVQVRDVDGNPMPAAALPPMRAVRGEVLTGKRAVEMQMHTLDGRDIWVSASAAPLTDASGTITGAVAVYRDITETHHLIESLKSSEARFRGIYEQAAVGIAIVSLEGTWVEVNARLCEITGYTRDELLGLTFQQVTYAPDLDADLEYVRRVRAGDLRSYTMDKRYVRKDGSLVWIKLSVAAIRDDEGPPLGFISVVEEIEDLKRAEASLRALNATLERRVNERTHELRAANEELEAFAYSVSHDLRAPLRAMEGFATALEEDYAADLDPTAHDYTARIVAAASRMDQLIADLLTYSRISREHMRLSPVALDDVVRRVLAGMAEERQARHAEIEVVTPLRKVMAQRVVLEQVLANLVGNALTFVASGIAPHVCIRAERTTRPAGDSGGPPEEWVRLWVEDNGIGIAPEYQQRIFRVFERLHGNEQYPGTGIGLAIVRRGMERMGGDAGVESTLGAGSRFWIDLRAAPPRQDGETC